MYQDTATIRTILTTTRAIAVVGLSADPDKPSHYVSAYMQAAGYRIIPVNPTVSDQILGERVYPDVASIPEPVDLVNVFRRSSECAAVVEQAIAIHAKAVWTQLGITCSEAAEKAQAEGLLVVMNRCLKIEHARYGSQIDTASFLGWISVAKLSHDVSRSTSHSEQRAVRCC